jgi:hypothetical protein
MPHLPKIEISPHKSQTKKLKYTELSWYNTPVGVMKIPEPVVNLRFLIF